MSFSHPLFCMASITCSLLFSSSTYSLCEKTLRCEIPESEYFITPVTFDPASKTHHEFVTELMCFSKRNLRPGKVLALIVYRVPNHKHYKQVVGFLTSEDRILTLKISRESKIVTKSVLPEGGNIIGAIYKDSSSNNVYLGEVSKGGKTYVMFDKMVEDMDLFSVNFNAQTQDVNHRSASW